MKLNWNKYLEGFFGFSTLLLFSFPILPFAVKGISIGVWILSCLLLLIVKKETIQIKKKDLKPLIIVSLPFILLLFSLLYTENLKRGFDLSLRMSLLLVIPWFYFLIQKYLTAKLFQIAKWVFVGATFILVLKSAGSSYVNREFLDRPLSAKELQYNGVTSETITNEKVTEIKYRRFKNHIEKATKVHSTYLGLFIISSLYFIGELLFERKKKMGFKILVFLMGAFMLAWLAYISVRAPVMAFLVACVFVLIFKIRSLKFILLGLISVISLIAILYVSIPFMKLRVDEVIENKLALPKSGDDPLLFNSTNVRLGSLFCSVDIFKSNFLLGIGVGDVQDALDDCYKNKIGAIIYTWDNYNNHNQYLFFADAAGVFGLMSFLLMMAYLLFVSIKRRDATGIFFFVSVALIFLSENVLTRTEGLMYFTIIGYFIFFYKNSDNDSYKR